MVGLHLLHIRVLSSLLTSPAAAARFAPGIALFMIAEILLNWVVLEKKDSCDTNPRLFCVDIGPLPWIGEAMKPFLAYISDVLDNPNVSQCDSTAIPTGGEVSARHSNHLRGSACGLSPFLHWCIRDHQVLAGCLRSF